MLSEEEKVLWEGRPSRRQIFACGAVLTAVSIAVWLMALGELAQAPGGSECLAGDCPAADRKAGFVVYFAAPVSFFFGAWLLLLSTFIRQISAVTTKRVLSISQKPWHRKPTLMQLPVKGATAMLNAAPLVTFGLIVNSPNAKQRMLLWAKSRAELKKAESMIDELSSADPAVQGHT